MSEIQIVDQCNKVMENGEYFFFLSSLSFDPKYPPPSVLFYFLFLYLF